MKNVLMVILFLCLYVSPVQALVLTPEVTHWSDSTENSPGLGFFPLHNPQPSLESISGGWYAWGTAFEFTIENDIIIESIESPIAVSRGIINHQPVFGTWNMNLTLYKGSTNISRGQVLPAGQMIPIGNQVFSENFVAHGHDLLPIGSPAGRKYTFQGVEDLDLTLTPGTYWATYFDGSVVTYVQPEVRLKGKEVKHPVVPEPATLMLLGGGLLGAFYRRKKLRTDLSPRRDLVRTSRRLNVNGR
jgi:hypothetical protein